MSKWAQFIANRFLNEIPGVLKKKKVKQEILADIDIEVLQYLCALFYMRVITNTEFKESFSILVDYHNRDGKYTE